MARTTYEVVKEFYDHAVKGEIDQMIPLLADDFTMYEADSIPIYGGTQYGPQGFAKLAGLLGEAWSIFEVRDMQVLDAGEYAIAYFRPRAVGRETGIEVDTYLAEFCRVRDGKIYELRAFYFDGGAVNAALTPTVTPARASASGG